MAGVGNTYLTLVDLFRQTEGDGDIADIIEILAQKDEMIADAPVFECNDGGGHLTSIRTGYPTPTWTALYQGVQPTKGTTTQVRDTTGMLEDWSEIDSRLVKKARNPAKFRMNEGKAHWHGMMNEVASTLWYGNTATDPEKFLGLHYRFNDTTAGNGGQIVKGDGAGSDNTSIWFITWGENSCHFIYPEGSKGGLQREDFGEDIKENSDGTLYKVFREHFQWDIGLSLRDWRGVARVCNIDVSNLTADASSGTDLIDKMIDAYYKLDNPNQPEGNTVIYAGLTVSKFLHKQAANKSNVHLDLEEFAGKKVTTFLGHPIRRSDAILETEATIS